jgi:DNA-binding NtrC family response regulator
MKHSVIVINKNRKENEELCTILSDADYSPQPLFVFADLESVLATAEILAVFIDTDSISLENRSIRSLNTKFPQVSLLLTSIKKSHPDLKEAIGQYVYAVISRPFDPEEVIYWLKCILADKPEPA